MLVAFQPIFVADTKIIYGYSLEAPLKVSRKSNISIGLNEILKNVMMK